jgi:hypothetical protein
MGTEAILKIPASFLSLTAKYEVDVDDLEKNKISSSFLESTQESYSF